jgi:hypothetical protein
MDISKIRTVGTREEVYKGLASRTAGNLQKNDIIEKIIGNRILYISKKISDKMKANISIFRTSNPNFLKSIQKKTMVVNNTELHNTQNIKTQNTNNQDLNIQNINKQDINKKKSKIIKTQKLMFKEKDNSFKTIYYPELQGMNLDKIKEELRQEEAEEDFGTIIPKQNVHTSFLIEEFPEISNNDFE